jgi:ribosomal protein S15P/S13E
MSRLISNIYVIYDANKRTIVSLHNESKKNEKDHQNERKMLSLERKIDKMIH